jgi:hypothetical protein
MSYERKMLEELAMPTRRQVERALLRALLKHGGVIKEFGAGQEIVDEIANDFGLNQHQRSAFLQTTYRKEHRIKNLSFGIGYCFVPQIRLRERILFHVQRRHFNSQEERNGCLRKMVLTKP